MQHFYRLAHSVDVTPLMHAVVRQPDLWNQDRFRTTFLNTPHAEVDDILLRFSDTTRCDTVGTVIGDDHPVWHAAAHRLPEAKRIILAVMARVGAYELGRVLITRLRPGKRILPHRDVDGSYVQTPDRMRYHVVLQGLPGSLYRTGGETVCMQTGDVWWFNPTEEHEVLNNSTDDRVHMLVDVRLWP